MASNAFSLSERWENIDHSEALGGDPDSENDYSDLSTDEEYDHAEAPIQSPPLLTVGDVQRALHPLRATADRVGKQVELFAENLDRLSVQNQQKHQKDCRKVLPLVLKYKKIAHDTVKHLKGIHASEKQRQSMRSRKRKPRNSSKNSSPRSACTVEDSDLGLKTTVEDLKRWEREAHTWNLLGLMLQVEYPIPYPDSQEPEFDQGFSRPTKNAEVHRYSSEKVVWDNFLAEDDLGWERHTVVEWLRKCADESGQDIDLIVKELEADADRGSGLWAHSWLYSKEAIKGQKRLRSWPQPLDPDAPGLDASLSITDQTKGLVTQLDPDAITRQGRCLEKQDHYFERAIWLACWEMVRRGKNWSYIREWCQERVEGWRAIVMRGDPRYADLENGGHGQISSVTANWQSRALWRKTCAIAAKNGGVDKYENAVYGILSGYLPSVKVVSSSWDDYLFAHYNSYLLRQFDRHVKSNYLDRLPAALTDRYGSFTFSTGAGQRAQSGNQIVMKMKGLVRTGKEAREPFKMLQGSLIAKAFDDFISTQGVYLAQSANRVEKSKILPSVKSDRPAASIVASITMNDYDLLRIITHILFIFQDLGLDLGEGFNRTSAENFVVAYIDYLSKAGKQQLLPLYASRLSPMRSINCLGRQLPFIRDHQERLTTMRLMKQCGIDILGVLAAQLQLIITDNPPEGVNSPNYPKLNVLESMKDENSLIHAIKTNFIGESITDDEQDLINGFEWYLLLDGNWQQTMMTGTVLYKHFLRAKGLAAARALAKAVSFSDISNKKTPGILGRTEDLSKNSEGSDDEAEMDNMNRNTRFRHSRRQRRRRSSSIFRANNERHLLLLHSRTFRDFEALFAVLDAMERWKGLADQDKNYSDPRHDGKKWKIMLQNATTEIETLIEPLLKGWLQYPKNGIHSVESVLGAALAKYYPDEEAAEFEQIRIACLPEVVLAYNTILNYGGFVISREFLLKSMDLAAMVTAEASNLASCFMSAGRMPELVNSLALSGRNMIQADEKGSRVGKSRKKLDGEALDLWNVKPPPKAD